MGALGVVVGVAALLVPFLYDVAWHEPGFQVPFEKCGESKRCLDDRLW